MAGKHPADEVQGRRPDVIQWWMSGEHQLAPPWLPMEERMIHRYFSEQEAFFDWTTKNGLYLEQSKTNRMLFDMAHDRQAFEEQLRKGPGVEYMIVGEPQPISGASHGSTTGVWNIRKQNREKRREQHGRQQDELETLGSYFIVGENVYQAPAVADVIGNRLLSSTTSLVKFFDKASSLSTWSPASGLTYHTSEINKSQGENASASATPSQSREGSVAPNSELQSLRATSVALGNPLPAARSSENDRDGHLLAQSLQLALLYGDEYIDENPIIGEPGQFSFTSSTAAVRKRKVELEKATAKAREAKEVARSTPPVKVENNRAPPAVMTQPRAGVKIDRERERKKSSDKSKRRKSRGNALSPGTPGSVSPTVPNSPT